MPTAGKLIGAICFAALAYFVSDLVKPYLDEGIAVGLLSPLNAFFGALMGWRIMGRGAGQGYYAAAGYGLTAVAATAFWSLFAWSGHAMLQNATRMRYNGPTEALQDMMSLSWDYIQIAAKPDVIGTAVVGAVLCAFLTEACARRWP